MASEVGRRQPCRTEPSTRGTGRNRQVDSAGKVPGHPAGGAELFSVGKKKTHVGCQKGCECDSRVRIKEKQWGTGFFLLRRAVNIIHGCRYFFLLF